MGLSSSVLAVSSTVNNTINITSKHYKHIPETISSPSFSSLAIKAKQNQTHPGVISSHLGPSSFQPPVFSAFKRQRSPRTFTRLLQFDWASLQSINIHTF